MRGRRGRTTTEEAVERHGAGWLVTRRSFLKRGAVAGAAATALYVAPQFTSTYARRAYAGITTPGCIPHFCVQKIDSNGLPVGTPMPVAPIDFPGTVQQFYNYGNATGNSGSGDAFSANTPGVNLDISTYDAWDGLEEIRSGSSPGGTLHGDIAVFLLLRTSDGQVHLVTILDSPNDGDGGAARIIYSGLPNNTAWSVEDDPGETANVTGSGDAHKDPTKAGTSSSPQGTAQIDVKWDPCCTDGGALTPPGSDPFDCNSKICIDFKSSAGIGPICFAYQKTPPAPDWLAPATGGAYDGAVNSKAPVVRLRELDSDFCILGDWSPTP